VRKRLGFIVGPACYCDDAHSRVLERVSKGRPDSTGTDDGDRVPANYRFHVRNLPGPEFDCLRRARGDGTNEK
jgi:hypothetical protein